MMDASQFGAVSVTFRAVAGSVGVFGSGAGVVLEGAAPAPLTTMGVPIPPASKA